jgi:hypothetical protein
MCSSQRHSPQSTTKKVSDDVQTGTLKEWGVPVVVHHDLRRIMCPMSKDRKDLQFKVVYMK